MKLLPPPIIDGLELLRLAQRQAPGKCKISTRDAKLPWWWFARPYFPRDAFITWRHPQWWWQKHDWLRGRINLFFARLGLWDIWMAGYFDKGKWRLDFWRSPRSWWRLERTGLEIASTSLRSLREQIDELEYEASRLRLTNQILRQIQILHDSGRVR